MRIMLRAGRFAGICAVASFATLVGGAAARADDASLLSQIGLMEGHLAMGHKLTAAGDAKQASLHYHHPMKELFAGIEADAKAKGGADLGDMLKALEKADESGGDVNKAFDAVMVSIEKIEATVNAPPAVVMASNVLMLQAAAEEYAKAYPKDALEALEEYQDSMGFVITADEIFDKIKPKLAEKDAANATVIEQGLDDLLKAWPDLKGPAKPVIDAAGVKALVDKVAAAAAALKS